MTKRERLQIEAAARNAIGHLFNCSPTNNPRALFGPEGPIHEFDIYAEGTVVGGVSTSPLQTGGGNRNTGGCDRACSELLWLSLWPGLEKRVHVLTDLPLAEWLVSHYQGATFPHLIDIYHYVKKTNTLTKVGGLAAPNPAFKRDALKRAP